MPPSPNVLAQDQQDRLRENRDSVLCRMRQAERRAGRPPGDCHLLAVVKTVPDEVAHALVQLGQTLLAESRVQNLAARPENLRRSAEFHLIGHLQTNKVRRALQLTAHFHSVDSERLLAVLAEEAERTGTAARIWLQVNVAGESQKHGCSPVDLQRLAERAVAATPLRVAGLMAMAPFTDDPAPLRRTFSGLRELSEALRREGVLPADAAGLSMGMSDDFEIAIEEGATLVRVGSALFEGIAR